MSKYNVHLTKRNKQKKHGKDLHTYTPFTLTPEVSS